MIVKRLFRANRGFDLVQALVVVVIIGALAAIAALTLLGQAGKGEKAAVQSDTSKAVSTAKRIQIDNGSSANWKAGIEGEIETEIPDAEVTDLGEDRSVPLVITVNKGSGGGGHGCVASLVLGGAVSYEASSGYTYACPDQQ